MNEKILQRTHSQLQFKKMGNTPYRQEELATYAPPLQHFSLIHAGIPLSIYRHQYNAEEIMEYQETIHTKQNVDRKLQTFYARYQHPYLVSTQYLKVEEAETCTEGTFTLKTFYERAVTNLSKVNDLPFSDSLHCYLVALKGFEILYKSYGYFQVFQNMFHVCQKGKLKIWCNQHVFKSVPEQYLLGEGKEEDMVIKVISIIDNNTDLSSRTFSLKNQLLKAEPLTFASAIVNFRKICREHRFAVSEYIESLQNASQIESVLDIYIPHNTQQKYFDTGLTFNPNKNKSNPVSTQDHSNRRRSRIFAQENQQQPPPLQRYYSQDPNTHSSDRKQRRVDLTIGSRHPSEDGFPEFGTRKVHRSLGSSRAQQNSQRKIEINQVYEHQPIVQTANKLYRYDSRETSLKKKGPKDIPKYPDKILYESHVNKLGTDRSTAELKPMRSPSPRIDTQPVRVSQYVSIGLSSRQMTAPQRSTILQERSASGRPHSQNSFHRQAQRITFSHPKPNPVAIRPVSQFTAPVQQYPQPIVYNSNPSPRIVFSTQSQQPSNLKKTTKMVQFPSSPPQFPRNEGHLSLPSPVQHTTIQQQQRPKVTTLQFRKESPAATPINPAPTQNNYRPSTPMTPTQLVRPEPTINSQFQMQLPERKSFEEAAKYFKEAESIPQSRVSASKASGNREKADSTSFDHKPTVSFKADPHNLVNGYVPVHISSLPKKQEPKQSQQQLSHLQSKILMLESFATNKILTNEFLNNQSHALSNIKWEKGENSGHDSVTSAFRQELLQENPSKPNLNLKKNETYPKKEQPIRVQSNYDALHTDPKLLQLIKTPSKPPTANYNDIYQTEKKESYDVIITKDYWDDKSKNWDPGHSKVIVEPFKKLEEDKYAPNSTWNQYMAKYANEGLLANPVQLTNQAYSSFEKKAFKKKLQAQFNKTSAISEKWQEENYCSTSHGSTTGNGKNYLQSLDPDLLEDMVAYGLDSNKGKVK